MQLVGVYNYFSIQNKPNGQYHLPFDRDEVMKFIHALPVRKIPYIGRVGERVLEAMGVKVWHYGRSITLMRDNVLDCRRHCQHSGDNSSYAPKVCCRISLQCIPWARIVTS